MAVAFAGICHAQDVLLKKDGSTILAKVLKITETEVEYKDFNNQDGPTRVISIANLQAINYQNGQKETFSEQTTNPAQKPDIVTNETVTKFSNDQQLMQMYNMGKLPSSPEQMQKKAKRLKIAGWTVGGVLFVGGVVAFGFMHADCESYYDYEDHYHDIPLGIGFSSIAAGIATWSGCYFRARKLERRSRYSVQSAPVFQQEFNVGNDRLVVGLDMLKDNTMKNQTLGMGLTYNF